MTGTRGVFTSAIRVSAATLSVVISSGILTIITTAAFGVTRRTDAYLIALAVPMTAVTVLSLAPSLAGIAVLTRERAERGDASAQVLSATFFWIVAGILGAGSLFLAVVRGPVVDLVAPGFGASDRALTADLMLVTIPAALLNAVANVLGAILNVRGRFAIAAMAPMIVNAVCTVVVVTGKDSGVIAWAAGYLAGSAAAFIILAIAAAEAGHRGWFILAPHHPALRGLLATVAPFVAITALTQAAALLVRTITSLLPEGTITGLNIALTLTNIPLGLFAYALGTTLLPAFARSLSQDPLRVRMLLRRGVRALAFALAPLVALTLVLAEPLVRVLFERGAFDARATTLTAEALRVYIVSLLFQPFIVVPHRALLGARETLVLFVVGAIETGSLATLTFLLASPLGHQGIAAAYVLAAIVNATLLTAASVSRFGVTDLLESILFTLAVIGIAAVAGLAAFGVSALSPTSAARIIEFAWLVIAAIAGFAAYLVLAWATPLSTVREVRALIAVPDR